MKSANIEDIELLDFHNILVDLLNSLSIVKSLSEVDHQRNITEKELLLNALNVLISNQDMECCSFFIKTDNNELVNLVGISINDEMHIVENSQYKPITFQFGEGLIGLAAQKDELMYSFDCENDERFSFYQHSSKPGSVICTPVRVLGELLGVLNISHPEANYFSGWHLHLLEIYKNLLSQLISNYRLFKQMELQIAKKTEYLQQALDEASLLKQRYESLSMVDSLTGLYNRRYFYEQANKAVATMQRYSDPVCLILIDLDFFKLINDNFGHNSGDQVLIDVAEALKSQMREPDIVARFGGEEFVILFAKTECENGILLAERVREAITDLHWDFNQKTISITASIGLYCLSQQGFDDYIQDHEQGHDKLIDECINRADLAMYKAKNQGKNQVVLFTEDLLDLLNLNT